MVNRKCNEILCNRTDNSEVDSSQQKWNHRSRLTNAESNRITDTKQMRTSSIFKSVENITTAEVLHSPGHNIRCPPQQRIHCTSIALCATNDEHLTLIAKSLSIFVTPKDIAGSEFHYTRTTEDPYFQPGNSCGWLTLYVFIIIDHAARLFQRTFDIISLYCTIPCRFYKENATNRNVMVHHMYIYSYIHS